MKLLVIILLLIAILANAFGIERLAVGMLIGFSLGLLIYQFFKEKENELS